MKTLLIQNLNQFLDALNLCETGIMTYEEVFSSAIIEKEELLAHIFCHENTLASKSLLKKTAFEVLAICILPGQQAFIQELTHGKSWIYVVSGTLNFDYHLDEKHQSSKNGEVLKLHPKESVHLNGSKGFQRIYNEREDHCMIIQLRT